MLKRIRRLGRNKCRLCYIVFGYDMELLNRNIKYNFNKNTSNKPVELFTILYTGESIIIKVYLSNNVIDNIHERIKYYLDKYCDDDVRFFTIFTEKIKSKHKYVLKELLSKILP